MAVAGRSPRGHLERIRTIIWATSVLISAKRPLRELESVLGSDGRWTGLWSRYARALVSPSRERILRIEKILPGTARYYFSPMWSLVINREFHRSELRAAVGCLDEKFQVAFIAQDESASGIFWRTDSSLPVLLDMATHLVDDPKMGLDAVTMILILIREAELRQDGMSYLMAMKAWAQLAFRRNHHAVLRRVPDWILDEVAEPLRYMRFAQSAVSALWETHVAAYCEKKYDGQDGFELIDCLNSTEPMLDVERMFANG